VSYIWRWTALFAVAAFAAMAAPPKPGPELNAFLKAVENRYNRARTLEVVFYESFVGPGQPRRTETGRLVLRKPGRMRWDYTRPAGKVFVSDGKWMWLYTPASNRVEKMKLKETDDMRAPLAFLLGRLNFTKEFRNLQARPEGEHTLIVAEPATANLPYTHVEFVVDAKHQIRRVKVTGYDRSVLEFRFDDEKLNPPLDARLFQFRPPKGVQVVEEGAE
jgi:outer membrane lipoprotein carrier protein